LFPRISFSALIRGSLERVEKHYGSFCMVEVPDLGDGFHAMWHELLYLAKNPPAPWTLIGAHMVALHGWRMGRKQPRASKDADILVNARVVSNGTERVSKVLLSRGRADRAYANFSKWTKYGRESAIRRRRWRSTMLSKVMS
jgi:hypothetical protein